MKSSSSQMIILFIHEDDIYLTKLYTVLWNTSVFTSGTKLHESYRVFMNGTSSALDGGIQVYMQEYAAATNALLQAEVCRRRVSPANRYVRTSIAGPLVHLGVAVAP